MEISHEMRDRIEGLARLLAEEVGEISEGEFGSPFEAIEVLGAKVANDSRRD